MLKMHIPKGKPKYCIKIDYILQRWKTSRIYKNYEEIGRNSIKKMKTFFCSIRFLLRGLYNRFLFFVFAREMINRNKIELRVGQKSE